MNRIWKKEVAEKRCHGIKQTVMATATQGIMWF